MIRIKRYIIFKLFGFLLVVFFLSIVHNSSGNSLPEVHNLRVQQRDGKKLVDIKFVLLDADGDKLSVKVEASDDNGASWTITPETLSGDFGDGITPGTEKQIQPLLRLLQMEGLIQK